ncbi:LytTR family transcriptional regulator DNA-binding domain-containing protein [Oceanobacillus profundus]|uniref:ATP-binding cassette domain-containing protein n=2 Tax=Oceanobacillus profundus TaxID=372463 RepID=A0A417YHR6_9BACI|nr:LytTR family transcriptional regulator DNA-binding domain-containing protein [Oceanobacillus profundus]MBR3118069.1 LytTR family transcriptional regulator DNA-binding domain-containing protein [Oceanobacillus sp.]MDO6451628.1 LytTR family transcriptional regulator DNA-binding domain-containing protein [Oceanobacillus profundus]PAE28431.1 ABC transporter ATP-binding protein [Paenibacillus sp. 7884-2]RHW32486.1 ATP-binding cassette domain-containing protein [Oceanobacillus profundus]
MTILTMKNIEKHEKDTQLFPAFNLEIAEGEITAIYSTLNVRSTLLNMILGKIPIVNGEIRVKEVTIAENKRGFLHQVGICFFEDGMYERLTVSEYFRFFYDLYEVKQTFERVIHLTQLEGKKNKRIRDLTFSEMKRVQYGRLLIQDPSLFVFEEPDLNVDMETKRVFINITRKIQEEDKSILVLTGNMESAVTVADRVYRLDEDGLRIIETETEEDTEERDTELIPAEETDNEKDTKPIQLNKIPTKVNDKIVLFDPPEIDYIESNDGQANIYIKGEAFPSSLTLTNLEERLQHFGFFRCHRSYIVNLQKVREVITWTRNSYSLILDDKEKSQVPLSKTKMAELKDLLGLK